MEGLQKGEVLSMELDLGRDREKDIFSVGLKDNCQLLQVRKLLS